MAASQLALQQGAKLFFSLLKKQVISVEENIAKPYMNEQEVEEVVQTLAEEADVYVFTTKEHIHMVSKGTGSIFANTFTQMKEKYTDLKTKKYFYLANLIICVFLVEVDSEQLEQIRWKEEGIPYGIIEQETTNILSRWKEREKEGEGFSKTFGIALKEMDELWNIEFSHRKEEKTNIARTSGTRLDFIYKALKPLADQKLIVNRQEEELIFPRPLLYERLIELYHNQQRYQIFRDLIKETKGKEGDYAKTE